MKYATNVEEILIKVDDIELYSKDIGVESATLEKSSNLIKEKTYEIVTINNKKVIKTKKLIEDLMFTIEDLERNMY